HAHVAGAPVHLAGALDHDESEAHKSGEQRAWINWRASSSSVVHALPLLDVLAAQQAIDAKEKPTIDLDATFRGAMVIVGQSAKSVGDRGPVPFSSDAPLVLAHANLLDNLLNERVLEPPSATSNIVIAILLGLLVGGVVTATRAIFGLAVFGASLALLWGVGVAVFSVDGWIPLAAPTVTVFAAAFAGGALNMWLRDADEKRLRQAFERYVAPHILDKILEKPEDVDIRGHSRVLTLLFSDIKGYTTLSNTLAPDAIVELLCTYLDTMVDILLKNEGTVDKIMGDGIMAFFGDPMPHSDHALRCVRAALEMQRATGELGEKWVARGLSPLQVRIGVATGEVFVGSIGSRQHLEYTAIGRPVNLASRLEGKAPPGGVLVSSETYALIKDHVEAREVRGLDLKGYAEGYDAWLVTGLLGGEQSTVTMEQRKNTRRAFFSEVVLVVDGKDVPARSTDISPGGMFIHADSLPVEGARVQVRASLQPVVQSPVRMDAVVTHVRGGGAGLKFTSVFSDDRRAIQALLEGVFGHEAWDEHGIKADGAAGFAYAIPASDVD
ncbi:MAG TPA: adenylate/guanylate cyclase domain-containing protein, partial [Myxococcota bacterium]